MMGRYRVKKDAPTLNETATGARAAERRTRNRPWQKRAAAAPAPNTLATPAAPRPKHSNAGATDTDWQEF
jgi:hypothetical protein